MKYSISVALLLLFSLPGMTQSASSLSSLPAVTIHLKKTDGAASPSPFRHFEILDERPDTARIGIHTYVPDLGNSRNRQLVFQQPACQELSAWLDAQFSRPDGPYTALIVLRSLWLSDANYLREDRIKNPEILYDRTHIRLKAEIYAIKDSEYIPILRFDTLQSYKRSNPYNNLSTYYSLWDRDLTAVLSDMVDSISVITTAKADHARHIRRDDIQRFNRSRFDVPITAADTLHAGVYANFEEFRTNRPSVNNYEIRLEKKDRMLYLRDAAGVSYYSHDAWGYCDGNNIYIMRNGTLLPVWREGNGFYFLGQTYKEHSMPDNSPNPDPHLAQRLNNHARDDQYPAQQAPDPSYLRNAYGGNSKYAVQLLRIYTIDMDSGNIY